MCRAGQQSSDIGEIFGIIRSDFGQWAGPVFDDTPTQCAAFSPLTCLSAENKFNLCVVPVGQIRQRQPKCAVAVCRVAEFPSDSGDIEDLIRRPVDEIIASDKSAQRVLWWTPVTNVSRLADWQLRESNEMGMKANARQQLIGRRWRRHGNCWHWQSTRIEFQWTTQSDSRIFWQKNVKRMFHPMGGRPEKNDTVNTAERVWSKNVGAVQRGWRCLVSVRTDEDLAADQKTLVESKVEEIVASLSHRLPGRHTIYFCWNLLKNAVRLWDLFSVHRSADKDGSSSHCWQKSLRNCVTGEENRFFAVSTSPREMYLWIGRPSLFHHFPFFIDFFVSSETWAAFTGWKWPTFASV